MYATFRRAAARLQHWGRPGVQRPGRCHRVRRTVFFYALSAALLPAAVAGQGFRGTATTTTRYLELRPIVADSVSFERVTERPDGGFEFEGRTVSCVTGLPCVFYRPGEVQEAVALTQDVGFTTWGYGLPGLSATVLLRARADLAGDFVWPNSDDHFDALLAYAQYNRGMVRARAGRQHNLSGLGFSGYDGLNLLVEPRDWVSIEGYAGRSLLRGTSEPRSEVLRGIEDFAFDTLSRNIYLLGASARFEPRTGTALTARYQREIQGTRGALQSERAGLDFSSNVLRPVRLEAALDYDLAFGRVGKAHVRAQAPLLRNRLLLEATARRYQPWFELFTIWGFFSPVGYNEGELRATWVAREDLRLWGTAGYRKYEESNATLIFGGLETDALRGELGAEWLGLDHFSFLGEYRYEKGFGAFASSGEGTARWTPLERVSVFVNGTASQQIEEFRVGEGIVWGFGGGGELRLARRAELVAGANVYRQTFENRQSAADWNQLRAYAALSIGFGEDPGAARRPGRIR